MTIEDITKYLLNYLFKHMDELIEENKRLREQLVAKDTERPILDVIEKEAQQMARAMGLISSNDDDNNDDPSDNNDDHEDGKA